MTYISIEVDLDEFNTKDILNDLEFRFNNKNRWGDGEKKHISDFCKRILQQPVSNKKETLLDSMKLEEFLEKANNIPIDKLREFLKQF